MQSNAQIIETDVVVIGGGSAGAHAALKVQTEGLRVLQVVKGFLGRSGASIEQLAERYDPSGRFKASVTLVPFASK